MLSILIPTYNHDVSDLVVELEKQASLSGIIFEIIVADDASKLPKIVEANNKINSITNCKYVVQNENLGRTGTRQNLAKLSKFNALLFLDADVTPKHDNFIEKFNIPSDAWEVKFGGISYKDETPTKEEILRWKYGKHRESLSLSARQNDPYLSINSGAFLIKKDLFLEINAKLNFKAYGLDNLFKQLLQERNILVVHIDNPVYHLGLENTAHFIQKSKESVNTTVELEKRGLIELNLRPLQKAFIKLKKFGMRKVFLFFMKLFDVPILKNLYSSNPSLLLFDLYRLQYYVELKSQKDA